MADACDDDVIDPLVQPLTRFPREDADGRPAAALGAARGGGHHLAETARDHRRAALGEQPPDLLGVLLVLGSAADDRDLDRHLCAMLGQ